MVVRAGTIRPVGAVVVHYEAPGDLADCLRSLFGGQRPPDQVVVVDNSERPEAKAAARSVAASVGARLVDPGANIGFAAGCNRGVAALDGCRSLFLLNQDARLGPDGLAPLIDTLEADQTCAAVSPLIVTEDGRVWFAGGVLDRALARLRRPGFGRPVTTVDRPPTETGWVNGCALAIRAEAWDQVDGFDEHYFLYWEDVDLSVRLVEAGWTLRLAPDVEVVHHRDPSGDGLRTLTPRSVEHAIRSRLLFLRHHLGWRHRLTAWPYSAVNALRLLTLATRAGGQPPGPILRAVAAGLRRGMTE